MTIRVVLAWDELLISTDRKGLDAIGFDPRVKDSQCLAGAPNFRNWSIVAQIGRQIGGALVELRDFTKHDITDNYLSWLSDPEVLRYSNQRFIRHSKITAMDYLATFENSTNYFLLMISKSSKLSIGTLTAYVHEAHGTADIGIMVGDKHCWGQGYGQDAWDTLVKNLIATKALRKITAGCSAANLAMRRIIERSGMALEGIRRDHELIGGQATDVHLYARFV